ncbi:MAG: YmdB family metallophosphoesterase [Candidatus Thorarchaeota archaeon]|jgi:hypothetical protein
MPSSGTLNILALGDIIGKPGRKALVKNLEALVEECNADFVLANGENASGGLGITPHVLGQPHLEAQGDQELPRQPGETAAAGQLPGGLAGPGLGPLPGP